MASKGKAPPPLRSRPPPDSPPFMSPLIPLESLILHRAARATFTLVQIPGMALGVSPARSSLPPYTSVPDLCLQSSGVELFPSLPLAALHSLEYWTLDVDTLGVVCFVATVLLIVYISCCPLSNFRLQGLPTPKLNSSVSLRGSPSPKPVSIARQSQRSKQSTSSPSRSGQTSTKEPS
ncbi:BnaC03g13090D [Brassica napus]|uniref:(rape) hypothetical protein n=1 Tax=Brassica napus TaxID=3708 RepID=A0A078FIF1_BRANA|nr:unnamed protein product [Brassica napus]CDY11883.1 BnaC03g13090D [Brassica napus]